MTKTIEELQAERTAKSLDRAAAERKAAREARDEEFKAAQEARTKEREEKKAAREKERNEEEYRRNQIDLTFTMQIEAVELQRDLLYIEIETIKDKDVLAMRFKQISLMNSTIARWRTERTKKKFE